MGEIADALRRARTRSGDPGPGPGIGRPIQREVRTQEPPPVAPAHAPTSAPDPAAAAKRRPATPIPAHRGVDSVQPVNQAIVIGEGPSVEACRQIALRLREQLDARDARSVAIVSGLRDEGKTTVACDLAIALASLSSGRAVALVDLDLRKPSLASDMSLPAEVGVEQILLGHATIDEVCTEIKKPALDVYPAVEPQRDAHELIVGAAFAQFVSELEQRYATVVFDTPPTLVVPDTLLIMRHVAACVPIARVGQTRARRFRHLISRLPSARVIGHILNGARPADLESHYYVYDASQEPRQRSFWSRDGSATR